jgi:uncharacterized damage-inducible protein DinB
MTQFSTLATFYNNWEKYQAGLVDAVKPLTSEQLALRAASGLRSVGELARHIAITRASWFHNALGEQGDEIARIAKRPWEDPSPQSAEELVKTLETTWRFMKSRLDVWTEGDMAVAFEREWQSKKHSLARSYVVWHLIEHDVHHGGELSYTLGMHGLKAPRI